MGTFDDAVKILDQLVDTWWASKNSQALAPIMRIYPLGGPSDVDDWLQVRDALLKIKGIEAAAAEAGQIQQALELIDRGLGMR